MTAGLTCTIRPDGADITIELKGDIDLVTKDELAAWLARVDEDYDRVFIDMARVRFLDSSGLNILARAGELFRSRTWSCSLIVTNASPHLRHVFEVAGMTQFLKVE